MRLYVDSISPNVRRVRMFVAELGVELTLVRVDTKNGAQRDSTFLKKNSFGQLPVLELEDGSCIAESVSICRYLEESHGATHSLFGDTALERAHIDMWQRRAELGLLIPAVEYGHHTAPFFDGVLKQLPQVAEHCAERMNATWSLFDDALAARLFVALERFTVADITLFCAMELAALWRQGPPTNLSHLHAWHQRIATRPSAAFAVYRRRE